jgi:hypothetical protein
MNSTAMDARTTADSPARKRLRAIGVDFFPGKAMPVCVFFCF